MKKLLQITLFLVFTSAAFAQCGQLVPNPTTGIPDCVGSSNSSGLGSVTSVSGSGPAWLTWTVSNPTTTPAISLAATTGQTSHRVIGTCGSATTFAPCAIVAGDVPTLNQDTTGASGSVTGETFPASGLIVGTTDTQTVTNKTLDGVTPTVMGYLDATSSVQTQLNSKAAIGVDINSSNQVTATHLASALPVNQGGTGLTSGTANTVLGGATPSMVTVTSSYVDNSIALTGTDINTSNQVTVTHLAAALPINQGGTATATGVAGAIPNASTTSAATWTVTPSLGTDNSVAGTLQLANGSAAAHTIWASGATTTNTIKGFTAVPTTGHVVTCTVSGTVCTLTDGGAPGSASPGGALGSVQFQSVSSTFGGASGYFYATAFGCVGDDSTDNTSCINTALAAVQTAKGGTLLFPAGTYKVNSCITLPNNATGTIYGQYPLRITGVSNTNGWNSLQGGSVFDFRCTSGSSTAGYFTSLGYGTVEIDHVTVINGGSGNGSTNPFFWMTNTTLLAHDMTVIGDVSLGGASNLQDVFQFGGGGSTQTNLVTSNWGGYGSQITNVWADYLKRFLFSNTTTNSVNAVPVSNNTLWAHMGSANLAAGCAFDLIGPADNQNTFANNLLEGTYPYFFCRGSNNVYSGNTVFDDTITNVYYFPTGGNTQNVILSSVPVSYSTLIGGVAGTAALISPTAFLVASSGGVGQPVLIGESSNPFYFADKGTGYPTLWSGGVTPSGTNYALSAGNGGDTYVNGTSDVYTGINNSLKEHLTNTLKTSTVTYRAPTFQSTGTGPTITGCGTISSQTAGSTSGTFVTSATSCAPALTGMPTSPTGYFCVMTDQTAATGTVIGSTSSTATSATFPTFVTVASDKIAFNCGIGF